MGWGGPLNLSCGVYICMLAKIQLLVSVWDFWGWIIVCEYQNKCGILYLSDLNVSNQMIPCLPKSTWMNEILWWWHLGWGSEVFSHHGKVGLLWTGDSFNLLQLKKRKITFYLFYSIIYVFAISPPYCCNQPRRPLERIILLSKFAPNQPHQPSLHLICAYPPLWIHHPFVFFSCHLPEELLRVMPCYPRNTPKQFALKLSMNTKRTPFVWHMHLSLFGWYHRGEGWGEFHDVIFF